MVSYFCGSTEESREALLVFHLKHNVGSIPSRLPMVSLNKKKKAKNAYLICANKSTMKLKRINFFNKKNRKKDKLYEIN